MEQRKYPGSPSTVEATQGALGSPLSGPNPYDHYAYYAPAIVLVRQRLPPTSAHHNRALDNSDILIIACNLIAL